MSGLAGYLLTIGAAVVALCGLVVKSRYDGARLERARLQAEAQRARDVADQVESDVGALDSAEAREELRKWSR